MIYKWQWQWNSNEVTMKQNNEGTFTLLSFAVAYNAHSSTSKTEWSKEKVLKNICKAMPKVWPECNRFYTEVIIANPKVRLLLKPCLQGDIIIILHNRW